ncbi:minor capsid protein [Aeromonas veronii]|uniref:minor capsid protein n=1 Tax=Aeromonas TaxID=642 RepID=UPI002E7C0E74|nr:minor capsid protein [Aeromonas caviae]MEE1913671.1 minor capsid protein [Aeromonas caviae]
MDVLTVLAGYLESRGVGKVGESIFVSEMPSETEGFLLFITGEGLQRHTDVSRYFRGTVFVATRAKGYQRSGDMAKAVFDVMDFEGLTANGLRILVCQPESLPGPFGRDESGFTEWLSSYELALTIE